MVAHRFFFVILHTIPHLNIHHYALSHNVKRSTFILLLFVTGVILLPWLGETLYHTKGEPREAIVAVSILQSGNWILPTSFGGDIPYKPPFLAWAIAALSAVFNGGVVTEFLSRLPSALAAMALLIGGWRISAPRIGRDKAWVMMLVTLTSFEFFRAAIVCRVDMVLTAAMVGGIYAVYTMRGRWSHGLLAALLFTIAVLTKGPIGAALPLLAMLIYDICRGERFWPSLGRLTLIGVASLILPALWYWAAAQQGGEIFVNRAIEENIGRLTGTMAYDSHVNPWYYNVLTLAWGLLPWTIPVLIALCYKRLRPHLRLPQRNDSFGMLSLVVTLTVFIFYCIPSSKRSVYLLPCYPFLAYGVTQVLYLISDTRLLRVYALILAWIAVIIPPVALGLMIGGATIGHITLTAPPAWTWIFGLLPTFGAGWWLRNHRNSRPLGASCAIVYGLYLAYAATFAAPILNSKSDVDAARAIQQQVPADTPLYMHVSSDSLIRYYTIGFYLNDRLINLASPDSLPAGGVLISDLGAADLPAAISERYKSDTLTSRSCDTRRPAIIHIPR